MTGNRIRVGLVVVALGIALSTGAAAAQTLEGSPNSGGVGPTNESIPPTTADELPATETRPPTLAFTDDSGPGATGRTLPFTGADVAQLVTIGLAAVGTGTVIVRRTRARRITT